MDDRAPDPDSLDPVERASTDELQALQLKRLSWSVQHAYDNVPHYRATFDSVGARPGDVQELGDLAKLPFTTKADLRENYPFGMFAVPREQVSRIHASSGTTGRATVVGYTAADIRTWARVMARSLRAGGVRPGDRVHVAYGYGLFTGGLGAHYGAEELGCTVIPMSGGMTERLEVGVFGAEPWTNDMRAELERRLDLHAVDIYGLSEIMGPGVAQECVDTKDGLHVWEDHFYPEIIDPVTLQVLPDGEEGELVFTSLTKEAMPIIRYRTRDLTRLLPGTARPMRRIEKITGRTDDMIILRGVNLRTPALSPHFQCVLRRSGALDDMTVRVERRIDASSAQAAAAGRDLRGLIKSIVGVSVAVDIVEPDAVERSMGKMRRVIDERVAR